MGNSLYTVDEKLFEIIEKRLDGHIGLYEHVTEAEVSSVIDAIFKNNTVDLVSIGRTWITEYSNNKYRNSFNGIQFTITCNTQTTMYTTFNVRFNENAISVSNDLMKSWIGGNNYYHGQFIKYISVAKKLLDGKYMYIPERYNVVCVPEKYVTFKYNTRNKSSFTLCDQSRFAFGKITKKSHGWIGGNNYFKQLFVAVNKDDFSDICDGVDAAVEHIYNESRNKYIAAFCLEPGASMLKFNSFITSTGIREDMRNYSIDDFYNTLNTLQNSSTAYRMDNIIIETKYLMTAFKCIRKGNSYKLVPSRSEDTSWYGINLTEDDFNAVIALASTCLDADEVSSWRLLGELKNV